MKLTLYEKAIVKATGQTGVLVDEGTVNGRHYFIIELDDEENTIDNHWDEELDPKK